MQKIDILGVSVRTSNNNGEAARDIPALWNKFMVEGIAEKIPNKVDETIYCLYTDYEKDHTTPYTTILGCAVNTLSTIPDGMVSKTIEVANYQKYTAKGNLNEGIVFNEWVKIWNSDLNRAYSTDFEVYGGKASNMENAEVDIFIALK
ncbi:MAG: GyrI-like domain-containing protein [Leadbetterella sp.]|jgi:predicted transcriptional regulator YdeE|nr:GyrI-like domain-containing protein [Leadbetterella sp.]